MLDLVANNYRNQIKKIVVASSRAIYGEGKYSCEQHGIVYPEIRREEFLSKGDYNCKCPVCSGDIFVLPTSEDSMIHPTSIYGITKQNQEQMVMLVGKSLGIPVVAFRFQNVYGPGQSLNNPYTGILSIFSTRIKNSNRIAIFEDGLESRDFVYIDDVVEATIRGLEKNMANYNIFNVGSSVSTDVFSVASTLKKNFKSNIEIIVTSNYRLGDIRHNFADMTKTNKLLEFYPVTSFQSGITKFCTWVNTQEILIDNYEKSISIMKEKGLYK